MLELTLTDHGSLLFVNAAWLHVCPYNNIHRAFTGSGFLVIAFCEIYYFFQDPAILFHTLQYVNEHAAYLCYINGKWAMCITCVIHMIHTAVIHTTVIHDTHQCVII